MPKRLSAFFYGEKASDREPVTLFDVGCSGGIDEEWEIFGLSLHAIGFDPLETEIERLTRAERRLHVHYEAAFVGLSSAQQKERERSEAALSEADRFYTNVYDRSSTRKALEILSYDYIKEQFNSGASKTYSSRHISLDEFAKERSITSVDFLKTDTDGHDAEVLIGAEALLESAVIGTKIECSFSGSKSPYARSFANVDRIMTQRGFYLFDLKPYTYTRAALPGPFRYEILAPTTCGSPDMADALYLRDLAHPDYERIFGFSATPERIIKALCILESFGLQDCAAELILSRADRLPYPTEHLLDLLVPDTFGAGISYKEYMRRFMADPKALFPSRLGNRPDLPIVMGAARELSLAHAVSYPQWGATAKATADGGLLLTTNAHTWGYALALPLPEREGTETLAIELEVIGGQIGVSLADPAYTQLAAETLVSPARKKSTVLIPVSAADATAALMIRNGPEAPSRAIISRVTLFTS